MANANVPLEIRQKLTGHASQDMNKQYTHLELETVRRAVESISRLPGKTLAQMNEFALQKRGQAAPADAEQSNPSQLISKKSHE
jgi:hypothetical protein